MEHWLHNPLLFPERYKNLVRFFAGLEIFSLLAFLVGYFAEIQWLAILGGSLQVVQDIDSMRRGILKPHFPIFFGILLALLFDPWYMGVFWSTALFTFLNIPLDIKRLKTGKLI